MQHLHHLGKGRLVAVLTFALLLPLLAGSAPAHAAPPPVSSVSDEIICLCGCNAVLSECPHQDCGWGIPAKQYISQELEAGQTPEALVDYYVQEYGEQVLAAPTKSGINLVAWVLPFVALAGAGVAVYVLVVRWTRRRPEEAGEAVVVPVSNGTSDELNRRLDEELRRFD
jgi:cytochrome c-type biogenesis protein CcmH